MTDLEIKAFEPEAFVMQFLSITDTQNGNVCINFLIFYEKQAVDVLLCLFSWTVE
jgi:hypothetical protein